jgi:hypothetical protein
LASLEPIHPILHLDRDESPVAEHKAAINQHILGGQHSLDSKCLPALHETLKYSTLKYCWAGHESGELWHRVYLSQRR